MHCTQIQRQTNLFVCAATSCMFHRLGIVPPSDIVGVKTTTAETTITTETTATTRVKQSIQPHEK